MVRTILVVFIVFTYTFLIGPFCIGYALLFGKADILYGAGRLGSRIALKLAGIKLSIKGEEQVEPGKTYLFIANHQSYFDPLAFLLAIPRDVKFIVKKELGKVPLLNIGMRLAGFIFIDRGDRADAVPRLQQAVTQMQRGHSFLIYPEGTRTRTGRIGPFKKGAFMMAIKAGVPVLPVTVRGSFEVMPPTRFRITPGTIALAFHPALETKDLSESSRDSLKEEVWRIIASELGETDALVIKGIGVENRS